MHRRPTKIYCILSRARALLLRLSSAGFIYLLLHGEFLVALITILTCESKPAKWQDIIQLNSFTCIKLRDNKNALNRRKKKGQTKKKKMREHANWAARARQGQEEGSQIKWNTMQISVCVCVCILYICYTYTIWYICCCAVKRFRFYVLSVPFGLFPLFFSKTFIFGGLLNAHILCTSPQNKINTKWEGDREWERHELQDFIHNLLCPRGRTATGCCLFRCFFYYFVYFLFLLCLICLGC